MRKIALVSIGCLLVAVAASAAPAAGLDREASAKARAAKSVRLHRFAGCDGFMRYVRRNAAAVAGPYGFGSVVREFAPPPTAEAPVAADGSAPAPAPPPPAEPAAPGVPGTDYSTTNVQEEGVDEPDTVKTDGKHVFALNQGTLHSVDVSGGKPVLLDSLALRYGFGELLLAGSHLLVLSSTSFPALEGLRGDAPSYYYGSVLTEVDVSDPAKLRVVGTLAVEGSYLSARLVGTSARIVLTTPPYAIEFAYPEAPTPQAELDAAQANDQRIAETQVRNWVPSYRLRNRRTGRTIQRRAVGCDEVRRPATFSGLGMLTVLTIDLDQGLKPVDSDAIMTDGQTVYASQSSLYIATQRWYDWSGYQPGEAVPSLTTVVHKLDISSPTETRYVGSGQVRGTVLNQYSMSEKDGFLRVATTDQPPWLPDQPQAESESFVTVLGEDGASLVKVGQVGELGKGERIYAVRFLGDVGYVVTFRQVDPLYTVDLSDPRNPTVKGALKIQGYSAYLHPVGDGLLLGVGQDATAEGRTLGTQLSLFDVSDLADPKRIAQRTLGKSWSDAEWDPHAFLYWPPTKLTVLPVQTYVWDELTGLEDYFLGAIGFRVDRTDGIDEIGRITHDNPPPPPPSEPLPPGMGFYYPLNAAIRRSLVIGDKLYTLSDVGLKASALDSLQDSAWLPFPTASGSAEPPPILVS